MSAPVPRRRATAARRRYWSSNARRLASPVTGSGAYRDSRRSVSASRPATVRSRASASLTEVSSTRRKSFRLSTRQCVRSMATTVAERAQDHLRGAAGGGLERAGATREDHEEAVGRVALLDDRVARGEDLLGRLRDQQLALLVRE